MSTLSPSARARAILGSAYGGAGWSVSGETGHVRDAAIPGGAAAVRMRMRAGGPAWELGAGVSHLTREQGAAWAAVTDGDGSAFGSIALDLRELLDLLPASAHAGVLDHLRAVAAEHEERMLGHQRTGRALRAAAGRIDSSWACSLPDPDGGFRDPLGLVCVRRLAADLHDGIGATPRGTWVVISLTRSYRDVLRLEGEYPRYWATRRGADDQARRVLDRPAYRGAAQRAGKPPA